MAMGVRIYNGNRITVIDDSTDILMVKDNIHTLSGSPLAYHEYIEDEIRGYEITSTLTKLDFEDTGFGTQNRMGSASQISAYNSSNNRINVRSRTLAKISKAGWSGPGYGMRIWSENPRKLIFDSGHKIFQPRAYHRLRLNNNIYMPNGSWLFPFTWWYSDFFSDAISLVRINANNFRLQVTSGNTGTVPTNRTLCSCWTMNNV